MPEISTTRSLSLGLALAPLIVLMAFLGLSVYAFGEDSSYGPNQVVLIFSGLFALLLGRYIGISWADLDEVLAESLKQAAKALFILLAVGSLVSSWMVAGIVPTMIYYGLNLLSPEVFYAASCLLCALVSLSIGSSWTTAATVGVALVGTAAGFGLSLEITAGAVISGAYFGDKLSPLSDTTNLASASSGADLFKHIRHMLWTTIPSILIALVVFTVLGLSNDVTGPSDTLNAAITALEAEFTISPFLLLPLFILFGMAAWGIPAFPSLIFGSLIGVIIAFLFQPTALANVSAASSVAAMDHGFKDLLGDLTRVWHIFYHEYTSNSSNEQIQNLLSRGGMTSMLNTIFLIMSAMFFGCCMERVGALQRILNSLVRFIQGTTSLVVATVLTGIGANAFTADQYMAVVLPGRMYRLQYRRFGLAPENLSRTVEDSSTVTSALFFWNTCGAYMAVTLGVSTLDYLPYAVFNWTTPIIAIIYGILHFKLIPLSEEEKNQFEEEQKNAGLDHTALGKA